MPKVLIISDSHGLEQELMDVKKRHQHEVDAMLHCGDSELSYDSKELEGFYYAKGNCDFEPEMENDQVVTVGDITFLLTHGHLYQIKSTLMPLSYKAEESGAQIACFGHSHIAGAEKVNEKLFINPGSCRLPRDREEPTYAILEWTSLDQLKLQFFHINGDVMPDLYLETSLAAKE
ncbi:phosphodiesterase [Halobacillus halophilus]|uniref:Phosphoesterase n=1 Tax=Halobacillus halophilus (strain ATCC 35676 / DSM 2266 / JCM 20832 / KCTC 3685 / LMG 17431 / NBRC 102448 / NCIMB 2269) TaxID=866895 RepID=I0JPH5_HALH3|nr:metallophosphoesterase [Halobacillus halophilus]ASF40082.1 phosphodiesterase [Halobacillus halophilus]CCG46045.1 putative phosphodiesterase [Halobacillus halophilus DSM 2266]